MTDTSRPTQVRREGGRVWIDDVPPARGGGNGYVRGLETMLAHAGTPVAYDRLMGLSGLAFITQADVEHRWEGKIDVGWWPLDPWGLQMRREFLARAIGYDLREVGWIAPTPAEYLAMRDRLPEVYREKIAPEVKRSIDAGRPMLATGDFGFLVFGYDNASSGPTVLGRCGCDTKGTLGHPEEWPIGLLVLGQRSKPMDIDAADVAALRYAVALAHDQAGPNEAQWRNRRFTGQKALAAWSSLLREAKEPVEDRHHANMKLRLHSNRTAAVAFLREVAGRGKGEAAESLRQAAGSYEAAMGLLGQIQPKGLSADPKARRDLADLVDRIAALERDAARHMDRAVTQMTVKPEGGKL